MKKAPLILIVEDSPTQAQKTGSILKVLYGMQVVIVANGIEALRAAVQHRPDLIILDVNLPGMDGYQVCKRLKRDTNTAHIPVIMLTSSDSSDAALDGLNAGADDYIPKDVFATDALLGTMRTYLKFS